MKYFLTSLLIVAFIIGLSAAYLQNRTPTKEEKETYKWTMTCETCGTEWGVISEFPPEEGKVLEWCQYDGDICQEGLEIITSPDYEQKEWILHCMECEGCKMAGFDSTKSFESHKESLNIK